VVSRDWLRQAIDAIHQKQKHRILRETASIVMNKSLSVPVALHLLHILLSLFCR
jgi:hypothetical protein